MHIAIDARMPTYRLGGISQYVLHLLPALAALDDAHRYTILHSRKEPGDFCPPGTTRFRRARLLTPPHHRWERWTLGLEVAWRRADVLHSPDFIPPAWGARRRVITVHDLAFLHYPYHLTAESRRYYNEQIAWAVAAADGIAADSEHTRQDLITMLDVPPQRVHTIPLAVNPIYKEPASAGDVAATLTQYGLPAGFLLFVGTLEPRKNLPTLLRAYHTLRHEAGVDLPLVLVGGKGWLYDEIFDTVAALGLKGEVRHLTGVPDRALAHLYQAAALLALPSHYEGFGLPPLEAMHCGCPVVVSDRASLREVVGDAGLRLPPDDVEAWTAGLARVLADDAFRACLVARGREQAARFTWEKTARATLALYEAVHTAEARSTLEKR